MSDGSTARAGAEVLSSVPLQVVASIGGGLHNPLLPSDTNDGQRRGSVNLVPARTCMGRRCTSCGSSCGARVFCALNSAQVVVGALLLAHGLWLAIYESSPPWIFAPLLSVGVVLVVAASLAWCTARYLSDFGIHLLVCVASYMYDVLNMLGTASGAIILLAKPKLVQELIDKVEETTPGALPLLLRDIRPLRVRLGGAVLCFALVVVQLTRLYLYYALRSHRLLTNKPTTNFGSTASWFDPRTRQVQLSHLVV
eukprot:SAG22_NODE_5321_length_1037_cov_1.551173_1_plen_253_part_10